MRDFLWAYFRETGEIGAYLLYKRLQMVREDEPDALRLSSAVRAQSEEGTSGGDASEP